MLAGYYTRLPPKPYVERSLDGLPDVRLDPDNTTCSYAVRVGDRDVQCSFPARRDACSAYNEDLSCAMREALCSPELILYALPGGEVLCEQEGPKWTAYASVAIFWTGLSVAVAASFGFHILIMMNLRTLS